MRSISASTRLDLLHRHDGIVLDQPAAEGGDGAALHPGVDLVLRAVDADDGVALVVADGAVGLGFDQRRPVAAPRPGARLLHGVPHRDDVVAVDRDAGDAVGRGARGDLRVERHVAQRRRRGVEVVLADEDDRRLAHAGEVQPLVEGRVVGRAVAEEGDRRRRPCRDTSRRSPRRRPRECRRRRGRWCRTGRSRCRRDAWCRRARRSSRRACRRARPSARSGSCPWPARGRGRDGWR